MSQPTKKTSSPRKNLPLPSPIIEPLTNSEIATSVHLHKKDEENKDRTVVVNSSEEMTKQEKVCDAVRNSKVAENMGPVFHPTEAKETESQLPPIVLFPTINIKTLLSLQTLAKRFSAKAKRKSVTLIEPQTVKCAHSWLTRGVTGESSVNLLELPKSSSSPFPKKCTKDSCFSTVINDINSQQNLYDKTANMNHLKKSRGVDPKTRISRKSLIPTNTYSISPINSAKKLFDIEEWRKLNRSINDILDTKKRLIPTPRRPIIKEPSFPAQKTDAKAQCRRIILCRPKYLKKYPHVRLYSQRVKLSKDN